MSKFYSISNCDSVKKAKHFLNRHALDFELQDFDKAGLTMANTQHWINSTDWQILLNPGRHT